MLGKSTILTSWDMQGTVVLQENVFVPRRCMLKGSVNWRDLNNLLSKKIFFLKKAKRERKEREREREGKAGRQEGR